MSCSGNSHVKKHLFLWFQTIISCYLIIIGEDWQKPGVKDESKDEAALPARGDPQVHSVEHDDDDTIGEKVSSVVRIATDIQPAPHPPAASAIKAGPKKDSTLEEATTMADLYFLSKITIVCLYFVDFLDAVIHDVVLVSYVVVVYTYS